MEKLKEVLSIQSSSYDQFRMFAYIIRQIQDIPNVDYYVSDGNIYIQRGRDLDSYPCIVAHMDTVHDIVEDLYPIEFDGCITGFNRVTMEQTGIGGDDKVGVYIAMECLRTFDNIKVAFFRDEEVGCAGSYSAHMPFFKDCRFVLQCDRRGHDDFIIDASGIELSSNDFQSDVLPIIEMFGYKFAKGMMTDVMALKENGIRCSVANMSCGYHNPHQANEYVCVAEVEMCLEMCKTIISRCKKVYKHKYKPKYIAQTYSYTKHQKPKVAVHQKDNNNIYWDDYYRSYKKFDKEPSYCQDCWGAEATHNGLCKTCYDWYKDHNDVISF